MRTRMCSHAFPIKRYTIISENESDVEGQPFVRYTKRLPCSCHLPIVFIGMAHVPTRSLELADKSLHIALQLCPDDPLVHHELGVVFYKNREYVLRRAFRHTLSFSPVRLTGYSTSLIFGAPQCWSLYAIIPNRPSCMVPSHVNRSLCISSYVVLYSAIFVLYVVGTQQPICPGNLNSRRYERALTHLAKCVSLTTEIQQIDASAYRDLLQTAYLNWGHAHRKLR